MWGVGMGVPLAVTEVPMCRLVEMRATGCWMTLWPTRGACTTYTRACVCCDWGGASVVFCVMCCRLCDCMVACMKHP